MFQAQVFHLQEHGFDVVINGLFGQAVDLNDAEATLAGKKGLGEKAPVVPGEEVEADGPGEQGFPQSAGQGFGLAGSGPEIAGNGVFIEEVLGYC